MTAVSTGDWQLKGRDADQQFALTDLSDTCIDAANRTAHRFDRGYPGWELYSRIVRGDTMFDRRLDAWAIGMARTYTRTRKLNGQAVVAPRGRRNSWIAAAGRDALYFVLHGYYPESALASSLRYNGHKEIYAQVRGALAAFMLEGFDNFRSELHYQLSRVIRDERAV